MNGAMAFGKGGMRRTRRNRSPLGGCARRSGLAKSGMPRPWISTNLAISADGKISDVGSRPSGWTSPKDHERLVSLRRSADALMVGRGTLEKDRMSLRVAANPRQPLRCIVSRQGGISPDHPVFQSDGGPVHLLVTGSTPFPPPPGVTEHRGNLTSFLETLAGDLGVNRLHCEGGGQLVRALAELDVIDEFHLTIAGHTIFGGANAPSITGVPGAFLPAGRSFSLEKFEPNPDSGECFLTYLRKR